jgi:hypothetical protein
MENTTYRCESCGRSGILDPSAHEGRYHDDAQTCWPAGYAPDRPMPAFPVELADHEGW